MVVIWATALRAIALCAAVIWATALLALSLCTAEEFIKLLLSGGAGAATV